MQLGSTGTERLLTLRLNTPEGPVNLLCVYAPTFSAPADINDDFYGQLDSFIKEFNKQEALIILGYFNARVGSDSEAWPNCIGHFGIGRCNDNGQRLLELCDYHELCVTNSFFCTKPYHRVSWRHPRSKTLAPNSHQEDPTEQLPCDQNLPQRRSLITHRSGHVFTITGTIYICGSIQSC